MYWCRGTTSLRSSSARSLAAARPQAVRPGLGSRLPSSSLGPVKPRHECARARAGAILLAQGALRHARVENRKTATHRGQVREAPMGGGGSDGQWMSRPKRLVGVLVGWNKIFHPLDRPLSSRPSGYASSGGTTGGTTGCALLAFPDKSEHDARLAAMPVFIGKTRISTGFTVLPRYTGLWARLDSNQGPTDYESAALTS